MKYYGIDLGTNNSIISCLDINNNNVEVKLVKDREGNSNIKSIVSIKDLSNVMVDKSNKSNLKNSFFLLKGKLGSEKYVNVTNQKVSVQYCIALLLNYMKREISDSKKVVITIPTFYNQSKRNATIEAGLQAGFEEVKLIEEPTAAVMYHIYNEYSKKETSLLKKKNILVFDFGGGTLDLSLVQADIDNDGIVNPKVIAIDGLDNLGGYLIDLLVAKFLIRSTIHITNGTEKEEIVNRALKILTNHISAYEDGNCNELFSGENESETNKVLYMYMEAAEKLKIDLSRSTKAYVNLEKILSNEEFDREIFEEILDSELIINKIKELVHKFKIKNTVEVNEVILVGGTSRIPKIIQLVRELFPNIRVIEDENSINAVAYGAAIVNALYNNEEVAPFGKNGCNGVLPRDIYLECNGKKEKIISAGTAYPLKKQEKIDFKIPFSLVENIEIILFEMDEKKEYKISNTKFYHPCFFTGDILEFYINIDKNGLLGFKVIHKETKEEIEFVSEKDNSLTSKQIEGGKRQIETNVIYGGN